MFKPDDKEREFQEFSDRISDMKTISIPEIDLTGMITDQVFEDESGV